MDARIRTCIHVQTQINVHTCIQTSMNTTTNTTRHLYKHTTCIFMRRRAHTHCGGNRSKVVSPERERAMSELRNEPMTSDHCLGDHQPSSPVQCTPEAVGIRWCHLTIFNYPFTCSASVLSCFHFPVSMALNFLVVQTGPEASDRV